MNAQSLCRVVVAFTLFVLFLGAGALRAEESGTNTTVAPLPPAGSTGGAGPALIMSAGTGLAWFSSDQSALYGGGSIGYSINASFMAQITESSPIYAGLDFGLDFWGFNVAPNEVVVGSSRERGAIGVQVLPSILYRFSLESVPNMNPYFGFSAGPNFYIFRDRTFTAGKGVVSNSGSGTSVFLEFLARPGLEYHFTDNVALTGELKFGIMDYNLIFLPQVAFTLAI